MLSNELLQILRFGLVGVWNTVFSLSLFWLFFKGLQKYTGKKTAKFFGIKIEAIAQGVSFLLANIVSYQLNSRFTFGDNNSTNTKFVLYVVISTISLLVSSGIMQYFTEEKFFKKTSSVVTRVFPKLNLKYDYFVFLVNLGSIAAVMIINYLGYKYIVFN